MAVYFKASKIIGNEAPISDAMVMFDAMVNPMQNAINE